MLSSYLRLFGRITPLHPTTLFRFNRTLATSPPRTLFDKIWKSHIVHQQEDHGTCLIYIDRHLVHEVTSPQAFEGLSIKGRKVRRPDCTLAVADHNVPTTNRASGIVDEESRIQVETLEKNCKTFGVPYIGMNDVRQGIVHIIGPEQGFTQPGMTIVCGDSHTATHGAFGALAFGIGTSEVEHVLATQTLVQQHAKNMRIVVKGKLPLGVTSKDLILHIIKTIGTAGGTGHVIEYAGEAITGLSMESRMTICNMSIEAGARAGMIAPDEVTFNYLKGRPLAPSGDNWNRALSYWRTLHSDPDAVFDKDIHIETKEITPQVTWGTSPQDVVPITGFVPDPKMETNPSRAKSVIRALEYMGLNPGQKITEIKIDKVFIGSCTNGRIEDLRAVAEIARGRKVAKGVHAMVVPGSGLVKQQAEEEGLAAILTQAGFEWRDAGCSMCLAMNADKLMPGERCASTSNRNFEGRQGNGGRTHLLSPAMAAAAAVTGRLADVRQFIRSYSTNSRSHMKSKGSLYPGHVESKRGYSTTSNPFQFTKLIGIAAPLDMINVDTDMIIPKQFLKTIKRTGLGKHLFYEVRYIIKKDEITENPEFILNKTPYKNAKILVTGENFGCGSSREHAPWAIGDFGIRCVIAPSFADIFYNNCFKNGILPVKLPKNEAEQLLNDAKSEDPVLEVDLSEQIVKRRNGSVCRFEVDPFRKYCLLNGLDEIGLTLQKESDIKKFEEKRAKEMVWM